MKKVIVALVAGLMVLVLVMGMVIACTVYVKVCVQVNAETVTQNVNKEWMEIIETNKEKERNEERAKEIEYLSNIDYNTLLNEYAYEVYGAGHYIVIAEEYKFSFGVAYKYDLYFMGEKVSDNLVLGGKSEMINAILAKKGY
jgi:hypothetical protein